MNKRDRLKAAIDGKPVDRAPVALWRHFPVDDQQPDQLAAAHLEFQAQYDFDFVKVTPTSSFCLRDWGVQDEWKGNPEGTREYVGRRIKEPKDWYSLAPLDPRAGKLGEQLEVLRQIKAGLPADTPFIQTIFSPFAQAKNLVGTDLLPVHLRQHPEDLKAGLASIAKSTLAFVEAAKSLGIDGIFYAVQLASTRNFSESEYEQFCEPLDREILDAVQDLWLNVVHLHGAPVMFDRVAQYPVQVINWHDRETPPSLYAAQERFNGALCGGWRQWETMVLGSPESVAAEAKEALSQTGGQRLILGTGCVTPITAPRANLRAARAAVGA